MRTVWVKGIVVGVTVGAAVGIGAFTFIYAKGASYLSNDPSACANCHIMQDHFDGWIKSSHSSVATCNDCHTPAGFAGKYWTKADNGFWHSFAFTTGRFPDPIRIKPRNRAITEQSCRKCHLQMVEDIETHGASSQLSCVRCHREVGHPK